MWVFFLNTYAPSVFIGVWHNFVLGVASLVVLFFLPAVLFPFYYTGAGALVTELTEVRVMNNSVFRKSPP